MTKSLFKNEFWRDMQDETGASILNTISLMAVVVTLLTAAYVVIQSNSGQIDSTINGSIDSHNQMWRSNR